LCSLGVWGAGEMYLRRTGERACGGRGLDGRDAPSAGVTLTHQSHQSGRDHCDSSRTLYAFSSNMLPKSKKHQYFSNELEKSMMFF